MCKAYKIAKRTVEEFLHKNEFKKEELREAIIKKGGVMRIKSGYTVKDYLDDLENKGIVAYIPEKKVYKVNARYLQI